MLPTPYRVVRRQREVPGVVTLTLQPVGDSPVAAPAPGQFNMLWAFGVGEAAISVSGRTREGDLLHTIRNVGATSRALCAARTGTVVGVRGPFGNGWDTDLAPGSDVVVVAGGLGQAPLRLLIRHLVAARRRLGRVAVLVGARSPDQLLYPEEMARWQRAGLEVAHTVDRAPPGWPGPVGLVTDLIERILRPGRPGAGASWQPGTATAFVCGPEPMMRFSARMLVQHGVDPARVQVSLERNMKCAVGLCGHCQLGPAFICRNGPVLPYAVAGPLMDVREL
jgi:anaerobic sulfite reductase subunit B